MWIWASECDVSATDIWEVAETAGSSPAPVGGLQVEGVGFERIWLQQQYDAM